MTRMTIAEAAKKMGVSQQFLRIGLQRGIFNFGHALKMTGQRHTYYICADKFNKYIGEQNG